MFGGAFRLRRRRFRPVGFRIFREPDSADVRACPVGFRKSGSDFRTEVLFSDDFEGGLSEFSGYVDNGTAKISAVSGADALSGKQSLCLDSMGSSQEWILAAELGKT